MYNNIQNDKNDGGDINANRGKISCKSCGEVFKSKNALFRHLKENTKKCLSEKEHLAYLSSTFSSEKVIILYGYIPAEKYLKDEVVNNQVIPCLPSDNESTRSSSYPIREVRGGESAMHVVLEAIQIYQDRIFDPKGLKQKHCSDKLPCSDPLSVSYGGTTRSYGNIGRCSDENVAQDENTGAVCEVLTCRLAPLSDTVSFDKTKNEEKKEETIDNNDDDRSLHKLQDWIDQINKIISNDILQDEQQQQKNGSVRIFGRLKVPSKFHAERDVTHRKAEYVLPIQFFYSKEENVIQSLLEESKGDTVGENASTNNDGFTYEEFMDMLPNFGSSLDSIESRNSRLLSHTQQNHHNPKTSFSSTSEGETLQQSHRPPNKTGLLFLFYMKKLMQKLTTQIEKIEDHKDYQLFQSERNNKRNDSNNNKKNKEESSSGEERDNKRTKTQDDVGKISKNKQKKDKKKKQKSNGDSNIKMSFLRRRRYHNFTPNLLAHDFLAFRRMDRFFHRATVRFDIDNQKQPFLILSLTGDQFLLGQVRGVIGVLVAIIKKKISEEVIDLIFDEQYPSLVPVPYMPHRGFYYMSSTYMTWEGKTKLILSPRQMAPKLLSSSGFSDSKIGWNKPYILDAVDRYTHEMQDQIAKSWYAENEGNIPDTGELKSVQQWEEQVLNPWAIKANKQLDDYRSWKKANEQRQIIQQQQTDISSSSKQDSCPVLNLLPSLDTIDQTVPQLYEKVLYYLRQASDSGLWPKTTLKRQLVMSSTKRTNIEKEKKNCDGDNEKITDESATETLPVEDINNINATQSLSYQLFKAKSNKGERDSAYVYEEGQGGASGSFSVGIMPGAGCEQPKGNSMFPELMKAAFELEVALCPTREPSAMIAINRNAQFRPHKDNGAGAGQSTSLIVGFGTYTGGELMVEGDKHDIRYKPLEFNGWTQRHWTLPFRGERFSLVWFTPKGCEGKRGIDFV